jgi:transcriptional regulator with XRE-family HTH domain
MDLSHPIDQAVRSKLRELAPNQVALASAIGRSQGWLNKYMQGDGTATIDDLVRIACAFIGVNVQPLSELERRLLKAFRGIPDDLRAGRKAFDSTKPGTACGSPPQNSASTCTTSRRERAIPIRG